MARDIAKANRAVAEAWKREKELVKMGMGTRDWTPDQQRDILATGKAHDADGKAFEGHHMKSVSKYPDFQGEPDNIQFLSRDEHMKAHGGKPTNGYYDYSLEKITVTFDDDTLIPIVPKPLTTLADEVKEIIAKASGPIQDTPAQSPNPPEQGHKTPAPSQSPPEQSHQTPPDGMNSAVTSDHDDDGFVDTPWDSFSAMDDLENTESFLQHYPIEETREKRGLFRRIKDGIEYLRDGIEDFKYEHPIISGIAEGVVRGSVKGAELYIEYKAASMMDSLYDSDDDETNYDSRRGQSDNPTHIDVSQSSESTTISYDPLAIEPEIPRIHDPEDTTGMGTPKAPHIRGGHPHRYRYKNEDGEWDYKTILLEDMKIHKELFDDDADEE